MRRGTAMPCQMRTRGRSTNQTVRGARCPSGPPWFLRREKWSRGSHGRHPKPFGAIREPTRARASRRGTPAAEAAAAAAASTTKALPASLLAQGAFLQPTLRPFTPQQTTPTWPRKRAGVKPSPARVFLLALPSLLLSRKGVLFSRSSPHTAFSWRLPRCSSLWPSLCLRPWVRRLGRALGTCAQRGAAAPTPGQAAGAHRLSPARPLGFGGEPSRRPTGSATGTVRLPTMGSRKSRLLLPMRRLRRW